MNLNFRPLNDAELAKLPDEELVAYIAAARRAGQTRAAVEATQVLASKHEQRVVAFVFNRLGSKGEQVVREVAERTIADAIRGAASFEGGTIKEFRKWVFVIARRRIVDYLRKDRVDEVPLEVDWGEGPEERRLGKDERDLSRPLEAVERASVFNQAYAELRQDSHKLVIVLTRFHDIPHKQIADQVNRHYGDQLNDPMTEQNVNQINSRFDRRLDELLDEADDLPVEDDDG